MELEELLGANVDVEFQPPPGYKLSYPALVYEQGNGKTIFASNYPYTFTKKYNLTYITRNPDDANVELIAMHFMMIVMDRPYVADNLYHYAYTLYY